MTHQINFHDVQVLCLGDLILDCFVYGNVERISPEAPIPVLKANRNFYALGGAGNVVRNLSSLGCQTTFIGVIGQDSSGDKANELLVNLPNVTAHLTSEGKTPFKSRYISQSQQLLRVDDESFLTLSNETLDTLKEIILTHLPHMNVVILSDYGKGSLSPELCQFVIEATKSANIPLLVDPKGKDYARYQGATLLTPNERELSEVCDHALSSDQDIAVALTNLKDTFNVDNMMVTRGSKGMTLLTSTHKIVHIPTQAREIFDVSGAGDTVIATLAAALGSGLSIEDAASMANKAAGLVIAKVGTAVVTHQELQQAISNQDVLRPSKILTPEILAENIQTWRRQGLSIGFTNGCFDLLHLGHLHILKQSKKACDRLIVGLNSDVSVQRLKGTSRPIQQEWVRSQVLAALEYVDGVILFEDDTPIVLIETILPDVLCKGADYTIDQVVGADVVHLNGGKVHLIDLLPGHSTTNTVAKLSSTQ